MATQVLELGVVLAAPSARYDSGLSADTLLHYLERHASGDWGDVRPEERAENEEHRRRGERAFPAVSEYTLPDDGGRLRIMTVYHGEVTHMQWFSTDQE